MGGGMSTANACTGSALFLVDLSDTANPGDFMVRRLMVVQ